MLDSIDSIGDGKQQHEGIPSDVTKQQQLVITSAIDEPLETKEQDHPESEAKEMDKAAIMRLSTSARDKRRNELKNLRLNQEKPSFFDGRAEILNVSPKKGNRVDRSSCSPTKRRFGQSENERQDHDSGLEMNWAAPEQPRVSPHAMVTEQRDASSSNEPLKPGIDRAPPSPIIASKEGIAVPTLSPAHNSSVALRNNLSDIRTRIKERRRIKLRKLQQQQQQQQQ